MCFARRCRVARCCFYSLLASVLLHAAMGSLCVPFLHRGLLRLSQFAPILMSWLVLFALFVLRWLQI